MAVPFADAKHFSVGAQDSVGMSAQETPANPSVPATNGDPQNPTLFERATALNTNGDPVEYDTGQPCFRPTGEATSKPVTRLPSAVADPDTTAGEVQAAAEVAAAEGQASLTADPLCGLLVYEAGTGDQQVSPVDQDIHRAGLVFDAQFAVYVGSYGLNDDSPWGLPLVGAPLHAAFHDAGSQFGLTEPNRPGLYDDDDGGTFEIGGAVMVPHALLVASEASGLYENNGWLFPFYDESIIAFLEETVTDVGGNVFLQPVPPERLEQIVNAEKANGLSADASPEVCGYSADQKVTTGAADSSACEVTFTYVRERGAPPGSPTFHGPYEDPCSSPVWVCGQLKQAYFADLVCASGLSICPDRHQFDFVGAATYARDGYDTTTDYDVWHFVVAPTESACNGAQEPGFDVDAGTKPYLAHDIDVYEVATAPAGFNQLMSISQWEAAVYTQNVQFGVTKPLSDHTFPIQIGGTVNGVEELVGSPGVYRGFVKGNRVEPNFAPVGDPAWDTSKSLASDPALVRTIEGGGDPCDRFIEPDVFGDAPSEDATTVDPWVDYIDNQVNLDGAGDQLGAGIEPYGSIGTRHHDRSNRPGLAQYFTEGFLGMFTDRDDNGAYAQNTASEMLTEITRTGAYPMFYDMRVKQEAGNWVVDETAGCSLGDKKLSKMLVDAGYGATTGLVQVVYLKEPTYWLNWDSGEVADYTGTGLVGANSFAPDAAYVFGTQSVLARLGSLPGGDVKATGWPADADPVMTAIIDDALARLIDKNGNVIDPAHIYFPSQHPDITFLVDTDWAIQCGRATGDYVSDWGFFHNCALDCVGDTVVTEYFFEVTRPSGQLGGGEIPVFKGADGVTAYDFGQGVNQWFDVDALDNDPDRNRVESSAAPSRPAPCQPWPACED